MKLFLALSLIAAPGLAGAETLDLLCPGSALQPQVSQTFATYFDALGQPIVMPQTTTTPVRTDEVVRFQVDSTGAGKVKLSEGLVPDFDRTKDGWATFSGAVVTADNIRAKLSLSFLSHPSVLIDRHTGEITMRGGQIAFNGVCSPAPPASDARKF